MPEWSKGADLSSAIERCVGSNPTGCIFVSEYLWVRELKLDKKDMCIGDVAQMVEHSLRMRGARGSIPLISIEFLNRMKKYMEI